jgi:YhgE/Pip-like protein
MMATDEDRATSRLGTRLWLTPAVIVTMLMAALAAMYLGGTVKSSDNIAQFPIAIVNADAGATTPSGEHVDIGGQIAGSLRGGAGNNRFDLRALSISEAEEQMGRAEIYGAIILPKGLTGKLMTLAAGAASGGPVQRPEIVVYTNPLANASSASIVGSFATQVLASANQAVGGQLLADAASPGGGSPGHDRTVPGAARLVLSAPMDVRVTPFRSIPDGTGNGLSAFYYALLLVLAGFTGSLIASNFVDARLGFIPSEVGPIYRMESGSGRTRAATLMIKWGLMTGLAVVVSTVYLGIAKWIGMPLDHPWSLWALSVLVISAVAVVVQAILALLGGLGIVVNLVLFIVLSIPSSGGTVPLEATPSFFRFLGDFEPLRQVYVGTRSVLYFGAAWDSGLSRAVTASAIALVAGVVAGLLGTRAYDRKGLARQHASFAFQE